MLKKIIFLIVIFFVYYQLDYKRSFIYNSDKSKVLTVWKRFGYNFYIIPGKYYSPFKPKENYIYSSNQGVSVLFNTKDSYDYKLGVFFQEKSPSFDSNILVYRMKDSLLLDYGILKELKPKRVYNTKKDSLRDEYDYKYFDLNRIYGIKVFDDWEKDKE